MTETYAELQAYVLDRLDRDNISTATVQTFIRQAESHLNRKLRHREMEAVNGNFSIAGREVDVPDGYLAHRSFRLIQPDEPHSRNRIVFEPLDVLEARYDAVGPPSRFSIYGAKMVVWPVPEASLTARLHYRKKIPALSDTNTTNWLLDDYPDVYVTGAIWEGLEWLKNVDEARRAQAAFNVAIEEVNMLEFDTISAPLELTAGCAVA